MAARHRVRVTTRQKTRSGRERVGKGKDPEKVSASLLPRTLLVPISLKALAALVLRHL